MPEMHVFCTHRDDSNIRWGPRAKKKLNLRCRNQEVIAHFLIFRELMDRNMYGVFSHQRYTTPGTRLTNIKTDGTEKSLH